MRIEIEDLAKSVRKLIDEVAHDAIEDFSTDLDAEIEQSIILAAQKLKRDLGRQFLIPKSFDSTLVYQDGDGSGTATLPDDFGTVVEFQLRGWKQPVTDLIEPNSTEAKQQMHPWTKGSPSKPVAMVTLKDEANVLMYWSAPKKNGTYQHELDHFHYMPVIDDSTDVLYIADEVYDLLLYQSASVLMLSKGETAIAEQLASMGTLQPMNSVAATD